MFKRINNIKEYEGGHQDLLTLKQSCELLNCPASSLAGVSNNGFGEVYLFNSELFFDKKEMTALSKCDVGALLGYKGMEALKTNAEIFENELIKG
jgi:hypothetical protein